MDIKQRQQRLDAIFRANELAYQIDALRRQLTALEAEDAAEQAREARRAAPPAPAALPAQDGEKNEYDAFFDFD